MRLTFQEYQAFRSEFRHLFWPDEDYRLPIEVEVPDGTIWTLYIRPDQLPAVRQWMRQARGQKEQAPAPSMELSAKQSRIEG
ncbi:MAG: hypothetical protein ACP5VE_00750 [Chthonomonadales bacterium]